MIIGVTTIEKAGAAAVETAKERAGTLGFPFTERRQNLTDTAELLGAEGLLIYGKKEPFLWTKEGEYRYHLNAAALRITQLSRGGHDRLCALLPEKRPLSVLDATFGMGSDSAVLSYYLGEEGSVTALEAEGVLWEIGRIGLASFDTGEEKVNTALRRISLHRSNYKTYVRHLAPGAFDVIYFDPMFRRHVKGSDNMDVFQKAASRDTLTEDFLQEAKEKARTIIVKERPFSPLFESPLFTEVHRRKGQTTAYGVIRT